MKPVKPKFQKLPGAGRKDGPFSIVIEVGPITLHNHTKAEANKIKREWRDELDRYARTMLQAGPRSKAVRSKIVEQETKP